MSNIRSKLLLVQHTDVLTKTIYRSSFFAIIHDIVIKIFSSPHPLTERTTACTNSTNRRRKTRRGFELLQLEHLQATVEECSAAISRSD